MIRKFFILMPLMLIAFSPLPGFSKEEGKNEEDNTVELSEAPAASSTEEKEYVAPVRPQYPPRGILSHSIDVAILFLGLLAASFIFIRKKPVTYARTLLILSMLYFGFFRHGCVCAPGATGNICIALFHSGKYVIDIFTVLIFFIPLLFALCCGRVFCGMICPFGAVQEFVSVRQKKLPRLIDRLLSWLPVLILAIACWKAIADKDLFLCRLDPFVSIFRLKVHLPSLLYGAAFLGLCIFIYRPFCKYICPYGVILGLLSRLSFYKKTFSSFCERCGSCADKCPTRCITQNTMEFSRCIACNRCINPDCRTTKN